MASSVSACLATPYKIRGVSYSISSACATSAHCIGHAVELIQLGKQDVVFAGGAEELSWECATEFDAMGAVSTLSLIHILFLYTSPCDIGGQKALIVLGDLLLIWQALSSYWV